MGRDRTAAVSPRLSLPAAVPMHPGASRQPHPLAGALLDRGDESGLRDDDVAAVTAAASYLLSPEWCFTRFAPRCRRRLGAANDRLAQ
jgi:hypothetical protein